MVEDVKKIIGYSRYCVMINHDDLVEGNYFVCTIV